jgi:acetate kinase
VRVLAVNAGSSTLKLSVVDDGVRRDTVTLDTGGAGLDAAGGRLGAAGGGLDAAAIDRVLAPWKPVDAVGHRVVHGGTEFLSPVVVDDTVRRRLQALVDLAPLHLPYSLAALDEVRRQCPGVPQVACFDTAFHASIPPAASTYALPAEWRERWPLKRFGFHGLSHAYASEQAAALAGEPLETLRVVTCHLGSGASLAAVASGRSVDTTMGFTPLDGLVMATRPGSVDPGLVLWLETHAGLTPETLASHLEHDAGLRGLCGHADMRAVLAAEDAGDERAALAVGVYLHRLRAGVAAMTAAMGGIDALVFTGGVGERASSIRERTGAGLGFLGVALDPPRNATAEPDVEVSAPGAPVRTFVVEAREDVQIARAVTAVLAQAAGVPGP